MEADGPVSARFPVCRGSARSRYGRYWRTLKDLPAQGRFVTLRVRVSPWRCRNVRRETVIFADRFRTVSSPRVQRTNRLGAVVHLFGHALGGRGGERPLSRLGMAISDNTILRLLKQPVPTPFALETLHVVAARPRPSTSHSQSTPRKRPADTWWRSISFRNTCPGFRREGRQPPARPLRGHALRSGAASFGDSEGGCRHSRCTSSRGNRWSRSSRQTEDG